MFEGVLRAGLSNAALSNFQQLLDHCNFWAIGPPRVLPHIYTSLTALLAQLFAAELDMAESGMNATLANAAAAVVDACAASTEEDEGSCYDPYQAKILSIISIFVVLVASAIGVFLPLFGKKFFKQCQPGSFTFIVGEWRSIFFVAFDNL